MGEAKRRRLQLTHCYLCGELLSEPINYDHVPPAMFYGGDVRHKYPLKLLTIPVHQPCNSQWQKDEEYFVYTFMPFVAGSEGGNAVWNDHVQRLRAGRNVPLANAIMQEFRRKVGGVHLPASKVAKLMDAERVHDVVWKLIRGLHFHRTREILPPRWTLAITVTAPGEQPPDHFIAFTSSGHFKSHGDYQGVFAYTFMKFPEVNNLHYWALLLWDRILITASFHDPTCDCEVCTFVGPLQPEPLSGTIKG